MYITNGTHHFSRLSVPIPISRPPQKHDYVSRIGSQFRVIANPIIGIQLPANRPACRIGHISYASTNRTRLQTSPPAAVPFLIGFLGGSLSFLRPMWLTWYRIFLHVGPN